MSNASILFNWAPFLSALLVGFALGRTALPAWVPSIPEAEWSKTETLSQGLPLYLFSLAIGWCGIDLGTSGALQIGQLSPTFFLKGAISIPPHSPLAIAFTTVGLVTTLISGVCLGLFLWSKAHGSTAGRV